MAHMLKFFFVSLNLVNSSVNSFKSPERRITKFIELTALINRKRIYDVKMLRHLERGYTRL